MVQELQQTSIKIAVTGPESCGKTTLALALSESLKADYVPEFAVTYLEEKQATYSQADLDEIALGQQKMITNSQKSIIISDSDYVVLQVWSEYRFGKASDLIRNLVKQERFDLYLLCAPDIPWEAGPFRENPYDREVLLQSYETILQKEGLPYLLINGSHDNRLKKSMEFVSRFTKFR